MNMNQADFDRYQAAWSGRRRQVWNPFTDPDSPEAFVPALVNDRRESPLLFLSIPTPILPRRWNKLTENLY